MRVFVLRLYTKFKVRRPSRSEDIWQSLVTRLMGLHRAKFGLP